MLAYPTKATVIVEYLNDDKFDGLIWNYKFFLQTYLSVCVFVCSVVYSSSGRSVADGSSETSSRQSDSDVLQVG